MNTHKTLDEYLLRDRLDDFDFTADIRKGLFAKGATFNDVSWIETEEVVNVAIKPLRDEIKRLREKLAIPAAQPAPQCDDCDKAAKHAYSDATTPGFFSPFCSKHQKPAPVDSTPHVCNSDCGYFYCPIENSTRPEENNAEKTDIPASSYSADSCNGSTEKMSTHPKPLSADIEIEVRRLLLRRGIEFNASIEQIVDATVEVMAAAPRTQGSEQSFEEFWMSTNNRNYFSVRPITVEILKQVAKESWDAANAAQPQPAPRQPVDRNNLARSSNR